MRTIKLEGAFPLECGENLHNIKIAFQTYGELNEDKSNVVWVCHALTGNQFADQWWSGIVGQGKLFDPTKDYIVAVNALGSCYGTTGPSSPRENQRPLLLDFPFVSIRDQVRILEIVRGELGLNTIQTVVGASFGGQVALEWSVHQPQLINNLILVASNAKHSAFGIAFNESQRLALKLDPTFGRLVNGGKDGLIAARSIAMLSYRSYKGYVQKLSCENSVADDLPANTYQRYQGQKLAKRFSPYSYYYLSKAMDSHDVSRSRGSLESVLEGVNSRVLTIGVDSDQLFPTSEQKFIARHVKNGSYAELHSNFGHDGFLVETEQLVVILKEFLEGTQRFKLTSLKPNFLNN